MQQYLEPIMWGSVLIMAMVIGQWLAIRRNKPDSEWLRRGQCPSCKSRKLLPTPTSRSSFILTCTNCHSQWFAIGTDGQTVVTGLGNRAYVPPLVVTFDEPMIVVFRTKLGIAKFDMAGVNAVYGMKGDTPRTFLKQLVNLGVKPVSIDLFGAGPNDDPFQYFLASAGIDLPFDRDE